MLDNYQKLFCSKKLKTAPTKKIISNQSFIKLSAFFL